MSIHNIPDPPKGLRYTWVTEPEMCNHCLAIVNPGPNSVLITLDPEHRRRQYEVEFPARQGVCLKCGVDKMATALAHIYNNTEEAVRDLPDGDDDMSKALAEKTLEVASATQHWMDKISDFINDVDSIPVNYEPGTQHEFDDEKDEEDDGSTGTSS